MAFSLSRRAMLRGIVAGSGVAVGLPLLEAMLDTHGEAHANGSPLARQLVTWMAANGYLLSRLEPDAVGPDWALTEQLQPLAEVKQHVNVCTGLECRGQIGDNLYGHYEGLTAFNGYPLVMGEGWDSGGPTIDQLVADHLADEVGTPVRSLQVGVSKAPFVQSGGNLGNAFSFRGDPDALTPLPPAFSPREVWEVLFGFLPSDASVDDRSVRVSMLDVVRGQTDRLQPKLGVRDRQRLDAHLQGLRELELKISAMPPVCPLPEQPTEENLAPLGEEPLTDVNLMMAELIAYAMRCDITRVASVQFLGLAGETPFTEAGLSSPAHADSHDAQSDPEVLERYHQAITYQMERLGDFARVFGESVDVRGASLLDSAIILASSDTSVGWMHSLSRYPMILIGSGEGYLRYPGIHVQSVPNNPADPDGFDTPYMPTAGNTSDVLLTVRQAFDPDATEVGGGPARSTTPLTDIIA